MEAEGPAQDSTTRARAASAARDAGSEASATRIGRSGAAPAPPPSGARRRHVAAAAGERERAERDDDGGRNLSASRMTYLPVNPEAPKMTTSNTSGVGAGGGGGVAIGG